jgi:hypothetical protein
MGSAIDSSQPSGRYTFRNVVSYHGDSDVRLVLLVLGLKCFDDDDDDEDHHRGRRFSSASQNTHTLFYQLSVCFFPGGL